MLTLGVDHSHKLFVTVFMHPEATLNPRLLTLLLF